MSIPIPTGLGIKAALFYLLLLAAFFAAPYANLFFLLLAFLTLLGVAGLVGCWRNLAGARAAVEELEPAPTGAGAAVRVTFDGGSRTRFALGVRLEMAGGAPVLVAGGVVRGPTQAVGRVPPLPRGVYPVTRASLVSRWPIGLFKLKVPLRAPRELIVYPAPARLTETHEGGGGVGDLYSALGGGGFLQPSSLREYRPGDELRLVHWKASARRGVLVIKEWEGGTGAGHELVLDLRTDPEALEEALAILSALVLAAKEQKELLTLHSQDLSATFGNRQRPWRELFAFLARARPLPAGAPPPPTVSPGILRLPWQPHGGAA
ncbi:MAG: DUF58 domain-containing protein [Planctomycetota bacterium]